MSRKIVDLCPRMQELFYKFNIMMQQSGIEFIVTCTYRSDEEQNALYAQGRTTPGKIVTNAKAGQTKHNAVDAEKNPASEAFDIAIVKNGAIDWNEKNPDWQKAGKIGQSLGLEWGGNWKSFKDLPHFQLKKD